MCDETKHENPEHNAYKAVLPTVRHMNPLEEFLNRAIT